MTQQSISPAEGAVSPHVPLEEFIRSNILSGHWKVGDRIPTEVQLATDFSLSRGTVRTILMQLVGEGLLYRIQGKGTFVSAPRTSMAFKNLGIRSLMDELLHIFVVRVVRAEYVKPPEWVARQLHLGANAKVFYLERARYRSIPDSTPCIYQYDWMLPELGENLDMAALVLGRLSTQLKNRHGKSPDHVKEWIEAAGATALEAQELKIGVGSPVLLVDELSFDEKNTPYLLTRFTMLPNLMRLEFG